MKKLAVLCMMCGMLAGCGNVEIDNYFEYLSEHEKDIAKKVIECLETCDGTCDEKGKCVTENNCNDICKNGKCNEKGECVTEITCSPETCAGTCDEDGRCVAKINCTAETCDGTCDEDGRCVSKIKCTAETCDGTCDEDGKCVAKINCTAETCAGTCDEDGKCVAKINCTAETCDGTCDEDGKCSGKIKCTAETCEGTCDEDGKCSGKIKCTAETCEGTCDEKDRCVAEIKCTAETCDGTCDEDGKCVSKIKCTAETCDGTCDEDGKCVSKINCTAETCDGTCDVDGKCVAEIKCTAETCDGTCNEKGECVSGGEQSECEGNLIGCEGVENGQYKKCVDGRWQLDDCPTGEVCDASSLTGCKAKSMNNCTNGEVKDGKICIDGKFKEDYKECQSNSDCNNGFECLFKKCVNSCETNEDCVSDYLCSEASENSEASEKCIKKGEKCSVNEQTPLDFYMNGKICLCSVEGKFDNKGVNGNTSCKNENDVAKAGDCKNGAVKDQQICVDGEKKDEYEECALATDCSDGLSCMAGVCVNSCGKDDDCLKGYGCSEGYCRKKCVISADKPLDLYNNQFNANKPVCQCNADGYYLGIDYQTNGNSCMAKDGVAVPGDCSNIGNKCKNGVKAVTCGSGEQNYCDVCLNSINYNKVKGKSVCVFDSSQGKVKIKLCNVNEVIVEDGSCSSGFEHVIVKNDNGNFVGENKTSVCYEKEEEFSWDNGNGMVHRGYEYYLKTNTERDCTVTGFPFVSCKNSFECGECMNDLKCIKNIEGEYYDDNTRYQGYEYIYGIGFEKDAGKCGWGYDSFSTFCSICNNFVKDNGYYGDVSCYNGQWDH